MLYSTTGSTLVRKTIVAVILAAAMLLVMTGVAGAFVPRALVRRAISVAGPRITPVP